MVNSLEFTLSFFESHRILSIILLSLGLFLLQPFLMVILLDVVTGTVIVMSFPYFETDPTKLVFTATGHMNATTVLVN